MLNVVTYTDAKPRFKAQHGIFSNSWVHNFLGILRESQINYFLETFLDVCYFKF